MKAGFSFWAALLDVARHMIAAVSIGACGGQVGREKSSEMVLLKSFYKDPGISEAQANCISFLQGFTFPAMKVIQIKEYI